MQKKDLLLVLLLAIGGILFILVPLLLLLGASLPQSSCVGLIKVNGEIVTESSGGMFSESGASSDGFSEMIKEAAKRDEIKAVLVEINSPGGSGVPSEEMYQAAKGLKKPKVMFFREVGASGAYLLAMGGDVVISHPDALTGSIGARITLSDMSGLFEKLGVNMTSVKSGSMKDMGDISRPPTDEELAVIQEIVNENFNAFKQVVLEARRGKPRFTTEGFEKILDARVLTGRQAYALGLVDELGSKDDALKKAAELGGITDAEPRVCRLNEQKSFFEALLSSSSQALSTVVANALRNISPAAAGSGVAVKLQ